jgi:hypothetical protein
MATKNDFTPEEWTQIKAAPLKGAMYIITASPSGPIGIIQEFVALAASIEELQKDAGALPLLKELFAEGEGEAKAETKIEISESDKGAAQRAALLAGLKETMALLEAKAGDDDVAVKQWIYGVAAKVAGAAKEGGFLGIGGKAVEAIIDLVVEVGLQLRHIGGGRVLGLRDKEVEIPGEHGGVPPEQKNRRPPTLDRRCKSTAPSGEGVAAYVRGRDLVSRRLLEV